MFQAKNQRSCSDVSALDLSAIRAFGELMLPWGYSKVKTGYVEKKTK